MPGARGLWIHRSSVACPERCDAGDAGLLYPELRGVVSQIYPSLADASCLLCQHDENALRLEVVRHLRLEHLVLSGDHDRIPQQDHQLFDSVHAIELVIQGPLEVLLIIETHEVDVHAAAVRVVHVPGEGVGQEVQLCAEAHERPVLEAESREERLAVQRVQDVIHAVDVELVESTRVLLRLRLLLSLLRACIHCLLRFGFLGRGGLNNSLLLLSFACGLGLDNFLVNGSLLCRRCRSLLVRKHFLPLLLGLQSKLLGLLRGLVRGLLRDARLVGGGLCMPRRQDLLPFLGLLCKPVPGLQSLDARRRLLGLHPILQVRPALRLLQPLEDNAVETLILLGDRELGEGGVQCVVNEIFGAALDVDLGRFLWAQLDLWRLFIHGRWLFLLFLLILFLVVLGRLLLFDKLFALRLGLLPLPHVLQLFPSLLRRLLLPLQHEGSLLLELLLLLRSLELLLLLVLFLLEVRVGNRLLLLQQDGMGSLLDAGGGVSHHHVCRDFEACTGPPGEKLSALGFQQICPDLHDDIVPRLDGRNGHQRFPNAAVIHGRDPKAVLRLVVASPRHVALGPDEAAELGPAQDGPVAELSVVGVLLEEHVQPVEGALVGQEDGEEHFGLGARGRRRLHHNVRSRSCLQHAARERERLDLLGAEVVMDQNVLERHAREKRFPNQVLRERLWLASAFAVDEQADGQAIGTRGVEV
mmetsp:Transcript_114481/g.363852  ORF Transcript_114481/g.363852 Transcript_114481/m.363852 type:complete len:698 (-) Transcript_114481:574-2667(-)